MKGILDCRACVERASDLVSGELPRAARWVSRVHVLLCKDCREHVRQLETTVTVLGGLDPAPPIDGERKRALLEALRAKK